MAACTGEYYWFTSKHLVGPAGSTSTMLTHTQPLLIAAPTHQPQPQSISSSGTAISSAAVRSNKHISTHTQQQQPIMSEGVAHIQHALTTGTVVSDLLNDPDATMTRHRNQSATTYLSESSSRGAAVNPCTTVQCSSRSRGPNKQGIGQQHACTTPEMHHANNDVSSAFT
jgi:hypothetical protein